MSTFFQWLIDIFRDIKFWFVVEPWEKAVRVRLGKDTCVLGPGMHWKLPVVDEIYVINTRLRLVPSSNQTVSTKDGRVVTVALQLGFSIADPLLALSTYLHPEFSLAVLLHNHAAEYITSRNSEEVNPTDLEAFVLAGVSDTENNGMLVEFVKVTTFVVSTPARTFRLLNDLTNTDYYTSVRERAKDQPNITQW